MIDFVPAPDPPRAFFSKCAAARERFIQERIAAHPGRVTLHLHPKNLPRKSGTPGVVCVSYEDINKKDVWLRINSLISDDTFLVLENPSRYPKISSEKVRFLRRLSMRLRGDRIIADIVPFTLSIEYLYTPYSLLGREILGYPHWYAFRENYQEMDDDGTIVNSLDFPVLARKAAPVSAIDYNGFLARDRAVVRYHESDDEYILYDDKRQKLFANYGNTSGGDGSSPPQKIVTRLADLTHAFESRGRCLVETADDLLSRTNGDLVVVTNLLSYAQTADRRLKAAGLPARFRATSYQLGAARADWDTVGAVVYAEAPIVNSHFRLDIEAALHDGCIVRHLQGDMKVDAYLQHLIADETDQIDGFTSALYSECQRIRSPYAGL